MQSELEGMRSYNAKLRHESQLVMTNDNHWISEQKYEHSFYLHKKSLKASYQYSLCILFISS